MNYQITAPLNGFVSKCAAHRADKLQFPAAFLTSGDEALLTDAVEELAEKLSAACRVKRSGMPVLHLRIGNERDFREEFQRMVYILNQKAGYANSYQGIVTLDLTEWQRDARCKELEAVLAYLKDTAKDRIYIFYAVTQKEEPLRAALSSWFAVEAAPLKMEKPAQLYNYTVGLLAEHYGVQVEESAKSGLHQCIAAMAQEADFGGVAQLHSYCRDIAWETGGLLNDRTLQGFQQKHSSKKKQQKNEVGLI